MPAGEWKDAATPTPFTPDVAAMLPAIGVPLKQVNGRNSAGGRGTTLGRCVLVMDGDDDTDGDVEAVEDEVPRTPQMRAHRRAAERAFMLRVPKHASVEVIIEGRTRSPEHSCYTKKIEQHDCWCV